MSKHNKDERFDYLEYSDQLNDEEREWIEKFYQAYHFDTGTGRDDILTTDEMKAEAARNNNAAKTDALFRSKKDGALVEVTENSQQFMEDASDEWQWQDAFKHFGYEEALECITRQALRDLGNKKFTLEITLNRYYEKRDRLRRQFNREKRK